MKVLTSTKSIRDNIEEIFKDHNQRRVAIVAFVGADARSFLPDPRKLELYCWPKPGSTNPVGVRKLMEAGTCVRFADNLHMKLYWSPAGAIIASANLSESALGKGTLLEIGVRIDASEIDIDKILSTLNDYPVTNGKLKELVKESHRIKMLLSRSLSKMKFEAWWVEKHGSDRIHLGWYDGILPAAQAAKRRARSLGYYDVTDYNNFPSSNCKEEDWVIQFFVRNRSVDINRIEWMCVEEVFKLATTDKAYHPEYPYHAVQYHPKSWFPGKPF